MACYDCVLRELPGFQCYIQVGISYQHHEFSTMHNGVDSCKYNAQQKVDWNG